jgi:hypothetical protein
MKYLSVCSGIEAATMAWHKLGWTPVAFSEIEPFPCAVLAHHYPNVPNLGDMTKYKEWPNYEEIDVLVGGTPCFAKGTLIASRRGLIPIEEIVVGDKVLTHLGRWQRVVDVGSKFASTMKITGQGQSSGIETTAEHPFYAREKSWRWVGRMSRKCEVSDADWVEAQNMPGKFWASPAVWPLSHAPKMRVMGREHNPPTLSDELAWVIGRWLGDGWCRINKRRGYVIICCGKHEKIHLGKKLKAAGIVFSTSEERTTTRFQIANRALARWLTKNFGSGAANKTMPCWVFGWQFRESLFKGYISADGCKTKNGFRLTTVSGKLALGCVLLANSLGKSTSRRLVNTNRTNCIIEGRVVCEKPFWQITIYNRSRSSVEIDGHRWGKVKSVTPHGNAIVYNLNVERDNSYVADGIVVHNCQSFSVAGLRKGLADPRGNLMLTYLAIAEKYKPRYVVWENVPGVLSSNGGRDFGTFLGMLGQLGYGFAYRVLDAQYVQNMPSFPEPFPNGGGVCSLSDILETGDVPQRFFLTVRKLVRGSCAAPRSGAKNCRNH